MNIYIEKLDISVKKFHLHCHDLNFDVGDTFLITAPNGSGKSMFLKGIVGLVKTSYRKIKINGVYTNELNLSKVIAAYLGEEFLIPFYEPMEYFELIGKIKGLDDSQIKFAVEGISKMFNQEWPKKFIRDLSTGMKKKVGLAGSLIGNPQIIMWDEPFENVDDEAQCLLRQFIENDKRLIIYSSPVRDNLPLSRVLGIESGRVLIEQ
ncbi:putative ATP-binding component of ABC transporter protein [Fulvivirga imtechensis AK7]|uniref:Putative ATP-binding component of ABC transporter protein n=1 Tax=Fulvivirga imtechensis AK7 TaxID=1237149 RepID=L8JQH4_9BACT|nr:ATP-binding cassette domain-containing protein [Fulvivirga imtechensis]ELR69719.1 putative ATP-binding component of ABC transporter protein [Fulvivirga imtechensis AK7]